MILSKTSWHTRPHTLKCPAKRSRMKLTLFYRSNHLTWTCQKIRIVHLHKRGKKLQFWNFSETVVKKSPGNPVVQRHVFARENDFQTILYGKMHLHYGLDEHKKSSKFQFFTVLYTQALWQCCCHAQTKEAHRPKKTFCFNQYLAVTKHFRSGFTVMLCFKSALWCLSTCQKWALSCNSVIMPTLCDSERNKDLFETNKIFWDTHIYRVDVFGAYFHGIPGFVVQLWLPEIL